MKLWPKGMVRPLRFHDLLGEAARLGFELMPGSAPETKPEGVSATGTDELLATPLLREAAPEKGKAGTAPEFPMRVPAFGLAGCRGLEPLASGVTGRRYNRLN